MSMRTVISKDRELALTTDCMVLHIGGQFKYIGLLWT